MGTDDRAPEPLPVRTSRFRPTGRHRSQHQLSVPPEAPALVLAVPGAESAASNDVAAGVAAAARASCPGVAVRYGYLRGGGQSLGTVLAGFRGHEGMPSAVVVPLLICPDAEVDADLEAAIEAGSFPVILAKPLGPHPVPVAAASLDDRASIGEATTQLREAGVRRVALAPCVIGPEFSQADVAAVAADAGLESARPLGAHPAVGQLAAMR